MRTTYLLLLAVVLVCCGRNEEASVRELKYMDLAPPLAVKMSPVSEKSYEADAMPANDAVQITERKLIRKGRIDFKT